MACDHLILLLLVLSCLCGFHLAWLLLLQRRRRITCAAGWGEGMAGSCAVRALGQLG
jgi:hypothetical protein